MALPNDCRQDPAILNSKKFADQYQPPQNPQPNPRVGPRMAAAAAANPAQKGQKADKPKEKLIHQFSNFSDNYKNISLSDMKKMNEQAKLYQDKVDEKLDHLPETEAMRAARELRDKRNNKNKGKAKSKSGKKGELGHVMAPVPSAAPYYEPPASSSLCGWGWVFCENRSYDMRIFGQ